MRRLLCILPVMAMALGGCDSGSKNAEPAVSVEGVRTDGERGLLLTFIGARPVTDASDPCARNYWAEVTPSEGRVVVTVRSLPPPAPLPRDFFCTAEGYLRTVSVQLERPLGDRTLVDGATGHARRPFNGATLLQPGFLPEGWGLQAEGPGFEEPEASVTWRRTFGPPRGAPVDGRCADAQNPVAVSQSPDRGVPDAGDPVTVRGNLAFVTHDTSGATQIRWVERGQTMEVAELPACAFTPHTDAGLLLRIANALG